MHLRASLGTGLLVLAWGVSACGGGATKPATTPLNVESAPVATTAPQPDLSPVAQPQDLVVVARVARAQSFVETLAAWAGVPTSLLNTLPAEVQALSAVIDWSAPVEAAAVLDRHSKRKSAAPEGVFSVGITSLAKALDLAREHGAKPTEVSPSIYRLDFDEEFSCALAPSLGPSRLRLVCGNGWTAVEDLLPYATRGLPTQPLAQQDVYLALNAAPLQARYGEEIGSIRLLTGLLLRQVQSDDPRLDRALTDSAYAIADEIKALALDSQRFEITGHLDTTKNYLSLGYALQFAGEQSFVVQLNKDLAARARPAPEVWFSLPKTADVSTFSLGLDGKRWQPIIAALGDLADALLERHKAAQPLRKHMRALVETLPPVLVSYSTAKGAIDKTDDTSWAGILERELGWQITVMDTRADRVTALLNAVAAVLTDREIARLAKAEFHTDLKVMPRVRTRVVKVAGFDPRATAYTLEIPGALLEALRDAPSGVKPKATKAATFSLIVAADGEQTWVSAGGSENEARTRLEGVRNGREGHLSDVPELAGFRGVPLVAGGFLNLKHVLTQLEQRLPGRVPSSTGLLSHAPNGGKSPWLVKLQSGPTPAGGGNELRGSIAIPKQTFEDLGAILPSLVGGK